MTWSFEKSDALALAVTLWGALTALPHLLWVLKKECVASCIETFPGHGDILLITRFSHEIVTTGSLFSHPDPVLRYPPIALAMLGGDLVGSFDPITVVVGYAWIWEFIVLPISVYLAVRWVAGEWAGAAAIIALIVTTHISTIVGPWPPAAFGTGNYQYALGVPTALLAVGASQLDESGIWTGALLGITANIQVAIALLAAFTVAACYALIQRWRSIGVAALITFLATIPTFALYVTDYTGGQTTNRALTFAGAVSVVGFLLAAALVVYLARTKPDAARRAAGRPFLIATGVCAIVTVAGIIHGTGVAAWWYTYVGGYVGKTTAAAAIGIMTARMFPRLIEEDRASSTEQAGA